MVLWENTEAAFNWVEGLRDHRAGGDYELAKQGLAGERWGVGMG